MRIAINDLSSPLWTAGKSFTEMLLRSLVASDQAQQVELTLLRVNPQLRPPSGVTVCDLPKPIDHDVWRLLQRKHQFDVLLPLTDRAFRGKGEAALGWIPDLQHRSLPEYFSEDEFVAREQIFDRLVRGCEKVMLSSHAVARDCADAYPDYTEKFFVNHFPSSLITEALSKDPERVLSKYSLPGTFVLVVNQFWKHKNHAILPPAVAKCKERGLHVVVVGQPSDYRDPTNAKLSEFLQAISRHGVHERFRLLGSVPREDLLDLMRCAAAILQPSLCEGWSTVVQDALALGRPVICSDIAVHREQTESSENVYRFDPRDEASLSSCLDTIPLTSGPCLDREQTLLADVPRQFVAYGDTLISQAKEARQAGSKVSSGKKARIFSLAALLRGLRAQT